MLPKTVRVTSIGGLNVRANPTTAAPVVRGLWFGQNVTVTQVGIGRGGIWGKIDGGWIALRYNGANLTSWAI